MATNFSDIISSDLKHILRNIALGFMLLYAVDYVTVGMHFPHKNTFCFFIVFIYDNPNSAAKLDSVRGAWFLLFKIVETAKHLLAKLSSLNNLNK